MNKFFTAKKLHFSICSEQTKPRERGHSVSFHEQLVLSHPSKAGCAQSPERQ